MMEIALSRSWPPPSHDMPYSTLNVMGAWPSWAAEILELACMGQSHDSQLRSECEPRLYTPRSAVLLFPDPPFRLLFHPRCTGVFPVGSSFVGECWSGEKPVGVLVSQCAKRRG
jgi:hypothetical protein